MLVSGSKLVVDFQWLSKACCSVLTMKTEKIGQSSEAMLAKVCKHRSVVSCKGCNELWTTWYCELNAITDSCKDCITPTVLLAGSKQCTATIGFTRTSYSTLVFRQICVLHCCPCAPTYGLRKLLHTQIVCGLLKIATDSFCVLCIAVVQCATRAIMAARLSFDPWYTPWQ